MTLLRDFALKATKRYLQSVVFVDDNIYKEIPVKVDLNAGPAQIMKIYKPSTTFSKPAEEGDASPAEAVEVLPEENAIPFHPKQLVESFAKQRMVCALYEPAEGFSTDSDSIIFKLCERADAVILDWELYKEPGTQVLPLIEGLVSASQTTVPHHVRLCAIYTTTPDLSRVAGQICSHLERAGLSMGLEKDGLRIVAGATKIVVLGKPTIGRPEDQRTKAEVAEADLADRIVEEFADMHVGILPSMALDGLAQVRTNSKKILDKFRSGMDGAFLVHRGLIFPGDDPFEQIPELLAEEALAVMSDTQISPDEATTLAEEVIDSFGISLNWNIENRNNPIAPGVIATNLLKKGTSSVPKKFKLDDSAIMALHRELDKENINAEKHLAALYNTRTLYGDRRDLGFGTVVRRIIEEKFEYSVCLMPVCDCVRLSAESNKIYRFPFWRLRGDNRQASSKGFVVELPSGNEFVELFSMGKPRDQMWIAGFNASDSKTVAAAHDGGRYVYRGVGPDKEIELEWVARLKPSHAQRIAHDIGASFSRVGVLEAEWLRRLADGR